MPVIGIDLGITYAVAARCLDAETEIIFLEGHPALPMVVGVDQRDRIVIGERARRLRNLRPQDTVAEVMRLIGTDHRVPLKEREYAPQELIALIFRRIKELAEEEIGEEITGIAISYPVYFGHKERGALHEAALLANLRVLRLVQEPVAAVHASGLLQEVADRQRFTLVYDLGASTLDVAAILIEDGDVTVIGADGDAHLGGRDFDNRISAWMEKWLHETSPDFLTSLDGAGREDLRLKLTRRAEEAKKFLCGPPARQEYHFAVAQVGVHEGRSVPFTETLSMQEFEEVTKDLVQRSLQYVDRVMAGVRERHACEESDLSDILLAGGGIHVPMVRRCLEERFPHAQVRGGEAGINPGEIVARGASIVAAQVDPDSEELVEAQLIDETRHTVGVPTLDPAAPAFDIIGSSRGVLGARHAHYAAAAERAQSLVSQERYEDALWVLETIDPTFGDYGGVQRLMAVCEFRLGVHCAHRGNFGEAITHLEEAQRLNPAEETIREQLAIARRLESDAPNIDAVEAAQTHMREGDYLQALSELETVSPSFSDYEGVKRLMAVCQLNLGVQYANEKNLSLAIEYLERAERHDPTETVIGEQLGQLRMIRRMGGFAALERQDESRRQAFETAQEVVDEFNSAISNNPITPQRAFELLQKLEGAVSSSGNDPQIVSLRDQLREAMGLGEAPRPPTMAMRTASSGRLFKRRKDRKGHPAKPGRTGLLGRLFKRRKDREGHPVQSREGAEPPEPTRPARGTPLMPTSRVDNVHFSVTSPPMVCPGTPFLIDVWAHLEQQRSIVMRRAREASGEAGIRIKSKGPVQVARGTILSVRLEVQDLVVEDPEDDILWEGDVGNAAFSVMVPKDLNPGPRRGLTRIYANGMQVARMYFEVQVGEHSSEGQPLETRQERLKMAFASYSSADREAVLARVHGMEKAAPHLDVFVDILSLRSGQDWEQELTTRIPASDIFYLFWSENARRSDWVEKEWRCALDSKGIDFIDPVPLVPPELAPPPDELASLHFNDRHLAFMRWQAPG